DFHVTGVQTCALPIWPHLLYVRTTRRMIGDYTLTHRDVQNQTRPSDSVGLALYGVDIYPVRRIPWIQDGVQGAATEGNMFIGGEIGRAPSREGAPRAM